uniref:FGENESH: predicted gene_15.23 protein n=1 Tax=Rhodotorula toruloides TaxID=5286 RepID=A0A0K3CUF5_RHOTO
MSVDLSGLGDEDLRGVPVPFIRDSLVNLAPRLLAGADSVTPLEYPLTESSQPSSPAQSRLSCTFDPPAHLPAGYCIPPTHLLAVSFPPAIPVPACEESKAVCEEPALKSDATTSLLTPTATPQTTSAPLPACPSSPCTDHSSALSLPLIRLRLPSPPAFQLIHTYIYTRTLPSPSLFAPSLHPASQAKAVEALWKTCVELGIEMGEAEELWSAMREEWRLAKEGVALEAEEEDEWASGESDEEDESECESEEEEMEQEEL